MEAISLRPGGTATAGTFASFAMGSRPQAPSETSSKKLSSEDVIKYTKDFIAQFREKFTEMPVELASSPLEVVINDVNEENSVGEETAASLWGKKEAQALASASSDGAAGAAPTGGAQKQEDKDWHAKPTSDNKAGGAAAGGGQGKGGQQKGGGKGGAGRVDLTPLPEGSEGAEIVRSENAWSRGATDDVSIQTTRAIKGILNKITPEKFDRLMEQLLECGIDNAATLAETISIVFDKAIWEPGFCGMYADVCVRLSKELPEFPSNDGGKPISFRRILLNTCQEEFEGAGKARDDLLRIDDAREKISATKKVKIRTMGNIKLIGELFKKKMIAEKILHACVTDLLGAPSNSPPEENIEALCNLLVTVGKEMDASPKLPRQMMEMYFARLLALSESEQVDSRVRFLCREVIELRKAQWVPRVKKLEAMTLSEIHAEAAAALGISPAQTEEILFPEGPGDGWEVVGGKSSGGKKGSSNNLTGMGGGKQSSLSGPYVAAAHTAAMPTEKEKLKRDAQLRETARERALASLAGPAASAETTDTEEPIVAAAAASGLFDAEKVEEKTKSLITEYMQVCDLKEAVLCVKEIMAGAKDAECLAAMTATIVAHVVEVSTEKATGLLTKLLVACVKECGVVSGAVQGDLDQQIEALEDIAIDVPMAPKLLGGMLAQLVIEGALDVTALGSSICKVDEGGMPTRRDFAVATLKELKAKGKMPLAKYVEQSGFDVKAALTGDEKMDGPLGEFLEKSGLKELC